MIPAKTTFMIDLNCDMGEGISTDEALMPFISSANIACGFHAGDAATIRQTIDLALQHGVAIGAHPGFDDKENFGRTEKWLSQKELYSLVSSQIILLFKACVEKGCSLHHVKLHGALYNMAATNAEMANTIAHAIKDIDDKLIVYGLSGSFLISESAVMGLPTASEVFADRTYNDDGTLTSRSQHGALIEDEKKAVEQVMQMIEQKKVTAVSGKLIPIHAQTICIHGDGKHAVDFAKNIHHSLEQKNIVIKTI